MSRILFIRHAETDMAGTFCGHSDPELNDRGRNQVIELIDKLRDENIDIVYTSDLLRAQSTGKAIAQSIGVDCIVRPGLREVNFGSWEGLTWKEIEERDKVHAQRWVDEHPRFAAPDGEEFSSFKRRVMGEFEFLSEEAIGRDVAVVTHGGVLRVVICAWMGISEEEAWKQAIPYCSVVRHTCVEPNLSSPLEIAS